MKMVKDISVGKLIYFIIEEFENNTIKKRQIPARVKEVYDLHIIAEYTLSGKKEQKAFRDGTYSETAYLMDF
jgi:hypothetical protein